MAQYRELVKSWSVDELLDKENELDAIEDSCPEEFVAEFRLAVIEELNSRGVFDARDYEEYDAWQGYEEPEDYPPFDDDNDFRADYIDYITERRAIEGPIEWF
jgi:hypothetical protein